jgi:hypothetical protein
MNSQAKVCSACGTRLVPGQVFCSECGKPASSDETPTYRTNEPASIPPPPPPPDFSSQNSSPYRPSFDSPPLTPPPNYPASSSAQGATPPPIYVRPPQRRGRPKVGVILLFVLLILGVAGYFTWNALSSRGRTTRITNGATVVSSGARATPASTSDVKTTPINKTVTYADDTITLVDVKQAKSFSDETTSGDILRLDVKEQTGDKAPYFGTYGYMSSFHLILSNGGSVEIANTQANTTVTPPPAQVSRANWLDFPVSVTTPLDQITLRLGNPNEHQIEVPLTSNTDVSKYQPRTATLNKLIHWGGLNWTLTTAAWQLSAEGNQADKDMAYVVLTFKVDSAPASGYLDQAVGDAFRLTADGSTTSASKYNTFAQSIAAGETGKTGTVGFLVPQNSTKYTLVLPVYDRGGITSTTQVTTDFQIP